MEDKDQPFNRGSIQRKIDSQGNVVKTTQRKFNKSIDETEKNENRVFHFITIKNIPESSVGSSHEENPLESME